MFAAVTLIVLASGGEALLAKAQALEQGGDDGAALTVLEQAVRADPSWPMARVELGRLQLKRGDRLDAAEVHLDVARSLAPENPRAHYLYALAADERGRRGEARRSLEVAIALRDDFADARFRLAGILFAEGDFAGAAGAYQRYVAAHPEATGARLQLAAALERGGRIKEAEAELRTLAKAPASKLVATRRLADLLEREGRKAEAQQLRSAVDPKRQLRALKPSSR